MYSGGKKQEKNMPKILINVVLIWASKWLTTQFCFQYEIARVSETNSANK